jgi:serine/threonine protein kinase
LVGAELVSEERLRFEQRLGSVIGSYVLDDVVGSGGMGVVYRAHHGETGRVVALKLMLPEVASSRKFRERFILEAQVAPELEHPHIVPVFDVGEVAGELFIAMRLVEGTDLKAVIEGDGAMEPRRALRLIRQAAGALDYAHERGVVHRDVKPQNLLLTTTAEGDDHLYLTDFGLVKPTSSESAASRTTDVFGSVQYMSPEQIEDLPTDGRADVYALGCVLFECLTGKPPFERSNEVAVLWAHVHEEPPRVTDIRNSVPGGIDLVLRQAMSKHPDDRYLTCGEFVDALDEGAKRQRRPLVAPVMRPLVKRIPRPKTEREVWAPNFFPEVSRIRKLTDQTNWVQVAAAITILCVLAAAIVQFSYKGGIVQAAADVGEVVSDAGGDIVDALAPGDAPEVGPESPSLSSSQRRGDSAVGSRRETQARAGTRPKAFAAPPLTAPGRGQRSGSDQPAAASEAGGKIVWADFGGVGPDGGRSPGDIWVMNEDGTNPEKLTSTGNDKWPSWSPDGRSIAFIRSTESASSLLTGDLWIMDADGSNERELGVCSDVCKDPEWSPDGRRLAVARASNVIVWNARTGSTKNIRPLLAASGPTWSPDGRMLAGACRSGSEAATLCIVSVRTNSLVDSIAASGSEFAWSPTGDLIAYERNGHIFVNSIEGSAERQLTSNPQRDNTEPSWSPDGRQIIYSGPLPGDLFVVPVEGGLARQLTTTPQHNDVMPDWWGPSP